MAILEETGEFEIYIMENIDCQILSIVTAGKNGDHILYEFLSSILVKGALTGEIEGWVYFLREINEYDRLIDDAWLVSSRKRMMTAAKDHNLCM